MALKRETLRAMGLSDEQIGSIIEMHSETVDGLKEQLSQYKDAAEKLPDVQRQLDEAKEAVNNSQKDSWKVKYDAIKEEFDNYKADIVANKTKADKESAYKELLKSIGVSEKLVEKVLKVTDLSANDLGDDGKFKDADAMTEAAKNEWADFIGKSETAPRVDTGGGLTTGGTAMSKKDIMAISNRGERRAAIAANKNLFVKGD